VDEPGNLRVAGRIDGCPGAANRHELTGRQAAASSSSTWALRRRHDPEHAHRRGARRPGDTRSRTARPVLEILGEASRVRRRGDEDWTHCQELITWAGKLALGRLKPTLTMPDEVWEFHRNESGGTSRWLEI